MKLTDLQRHQLRSAQADIVALLRSFNEETFVGEIKEINLRNEFRSDLQGAKIIIERLNSKLN